MGRLVRPVHELNGQAKPQHLPKQPTFGTIPCLHLLLPPTARQDVPRLCYAGKG
ncbi:hypothetical protein MGG_17930 [Pyricularia oryzae 70-15]|uniref:Uncharacterized protein n=2 Tax=Pyricularia oryzae TaxID=318829 RepID=G4NLL6_PYRO7|nr:uncharacterized protein MGG_17930 [Pyricularia oryzae 70-15]EHA46069.1 hypothetical protein MGG_17930 [Pyricularia oryzae 70-15]KAI7921441.1 hypothetical protein M9X92_005412 [Pyricularia oryzae]KAI7922152.1 hypothetical protein M0657_005772 [Pyricularia oryzae]QBZ65818.1 hypothetical protein PoMZ_12782 [Pyricularia oryzae]